MTRRAPPQPGVDRMVSTSWSGRRWSSPAARQGRALARGLEGHLPLQHHHVSDQNSSSSRCWAYFSLAFKHGIYRDWVALGAGPDSVCCYGDLEGWRVWTRNWRIGRLCASRRGSGDGELGGGRPPPLSELSMLWARRTRPDLEAHLVEPAHQGTDRSRGPAYLPEHRSGNCSRRRYGLRVRRP